MNFDITFGYPAWFLIICLLLGGGYAMALYYRNKDGLGKNASIALGIIRFVAVFLLSVLLLSPMIERLTRVTEDPMILFVQDNSESIKLVPDSIYYSNDYPLEVKLFKTELGNDYDVRTYTFGKSFSSNNEFTFDEKITNMSAIFEGLQTSYSNRNVGAVIIASDGIYNRGINPVYASATNKFPVYTIALGDTTVHKDVILTDVHHNRITYLGNKFPLRVNIEARECLGETSTLTVARDNEILFSKSINFTTNHHFQTVDLTLEADEVGMQRYHVNLSPVENEITIDNNSMDIFIEVLDSRQKILILSNSPHPDVGAIKQSLEDNENYEVKSYGIDEFDENVEQFNLVILHQLPSSKNPQPAALRKIFEHNIPQLFIIGSQTNINRFNNLNTGLKIRLRSRQFNEALPYLNQNFALFSISKDAADFFDMLPPLFPHFAQYETGDSRHTFLFQKIGNVVTDEPLIVFIDHADTKTGIITGEGIWRWRMHNFMHRGNHNFFDELLSKTAQYLSILEDKNQLRIFSENIFYENEPVTFTAEVYNHSYELINEPELHLTIFNEEDADYPFVFNRTSNAYALNAGTFPPGDYRYEARVFIGNDRFNHYGEFSVTELNIEKLQTIANHQILHRLATENDGKLFYPGQWSELIREIKQREDIKPILYTQKQFEDAISLRGIFFLILLLITIEWFVRKRSGIY